MDANTFQASSNEGAPVSGPKQSPALDYYRMTEFELVEFAQRGHRDAFGEIMQRCSQKLFRVARSVLRDDHEAEDAVQEAYACAFAKLSAFRGEASFQTWLTRITLNEARGRLRRRRSLVDLDQIEAAQQGGARVLMFPGGQTADDPETEVGRAQVRRVLEQAVDSLPETFRLVFIMRDVQDCSVQETAAALGLRPETVKTRLHRARRLLRNTLHKRLASTMSEAFPFLGPRCARITENVLSRLADKYGWSR